MNLLYPIVSKIISEIQKAKYRQCLKSFESPKEIQLQVLEKILKRMQGTEISRQLGIEGALSYEFFKQHCPVTDYRNYQDLCQDMFNNDNSPLRMSRNPCHFFVVTSGTTSKPKYFPLQQDYREEYMRTFLPWLGCIRTLRPETFDGKAMYLADATLLGKSPTGVNCGVMSGYNFRNIPKMVRRELYCTHEDFYTLGDNHKTNITLLAHSINSKLTLLGTIMPETVQLFLRLLFENGDVILSYLKTGKPPFFVPKEIEKSFTFEPNGEAYERIKALLKRGEIKNIHEVYPHLKTIICWKSSTAKFYLDRLSKIIPETVEIWDGVYSASEGWMNFPMSTTETGGPLAIWSHFLEFSEVNDQSGRLIPMWELKEGQHYEIYLTTSMGLFRYRMYDKILVKGFYKKTPIIEFVEKTGEFLAIAMERITPEHVQKCMEILQKDLRISSSAINYFTMGACYKQELPHYTLLIETDLSQSIFENYNVNQVMCKVNPNYERNMKGKLLGEIKIAIIKPGHIREILRKREVEGASIAQFKYSSIEKDRQIIEKSCSCGC